MTLEKCSVNSLYYIKKEIKIIERELEELSNLGSPVMSDTPVSHDVGDPTQKYVIKKIRLENRLNKLLDKYTTKYEKIIKFIDDIEDDEIRLIARLRFIDNKSWNEIADELSYGGKYISEDAPRKKLYRFLQKNYKT